MLRAERITRIYDIVSKRRFVSISDLTKELSASKSTVLRDVDELYRAGRVVKTRGGVMSRQGEAAQAEEPSPKIKSALFVDQKERIAAKAMDYIRTSSSVFLDAGTTTLAIARRINREINRPLIVVTYDLSIAMELCANAFTEVIVIGGVLRHNFNTTTGYFAESMLEGIHVDKVFLGADGIDPDGGVLNFSVEDIGIKRQLVSRIADEVILVCDHSKFNAHSLLKVCDLSDVDRIITGSELASDLAEQLSSSGVSFVLA